MSFFLDNRLTEQQIELLKSFRYLSNAKSINEVRELLSLYYEHRLNNAIDKTESENNYTQQVYETWLARQKYNGA